MFDAFANDSDDFDDFDDFNASGDSSLFAQCRGHSPGPLGSGPLATRMWAPG